MKMFPGQSSDDEVLTRNEQALLVVLKVLAHTGNDNFVDVITEICILAVSFSASLFPQNEGS